MVLHLLLKIQQLQTRMSTVTIFLEWEPYSYTESRDVRLRPAPSDFKLSFSILAFHSFVFADVMIMSVLLLF